MPGYDYRIRRNTFRNRNIEKHMDFRSVEHRYRSGRRVRAISKLLLILIALIILIGILVFTAGASQTSPPSNEDFSELKFEVPDSL